MGNGTGHARTDAPIEVLLVEDNPGDVRLVREGFEQTSVEMTLRVASTGDEAVEMLARRQDAASESLPDLVLLDLNLPRMDGFEVLDTIRDDPALVHLPVLVLTSSVAGEDVRRSYERGANAYLTKPVAPDEFVSFVEAITTFWLDCATLPSA